MEDGSDKNLLLSMDEIVPTIESRVPSNLSEGGTDRFVIAIAGPPAAGKSTLARQLIERLDGRAGLLAMDAYHFDDAVLNERGHRDRKGAPHTFDVASYALMLEALRRGGTTYAVPEFDRDLELSRNCASVVDANQSVLITEGNYLLLNSEPWAGLEPLFDLTVWVEVDRATVEQRIRSRWSEAGIPVAEAERRLHDNDLANYRTVCEGSRSANLTVLTA